MQSYFIVAVSAFFFGTAILGGRWFNTAGLFAAIVYFVWLPRYVARKLRNSEKPNLG
jgi:hypothetical protein